MWINRPSFCSYLTSASAKQTFRLRNKSAFNAKNTKLLITKVESNIYATINLLHAVNQSLSERFRMLIAQHSVCTAYFCSVLGVKKYAKHGVMLKRGKNKGGRSVLVETMKLDTTRKTEKLRNNASFVCTLYIICIRANKLTPPPYSSFPYIC